MRALPCAFLLLALPLAIGACDLTDPFPDGDGGAFDGGGGSGGDDGTGGTGGETPVDECSDDDECPAATPVCASLPGERALECVQCRDSSFCPSERPVCDAALRCIPGDEGVCRDEFDCPVATPQCLLLSNGVVGVCVECRDPNDCPRAAPTCSTAGRCIGGAAFPGCSEDEECGPGRVCDGSRRCVER